MLAFKPAERLSVQAAAHLFGSAAISISCCAAKKLSEWPAGPPAHQLFCSQGCTASFTDGFAHRARIADLRDDEALATPGVQRFTSSSSYPSSLSEYRRETQKAICLNYALCSHLCSNCLLFLRFRPNEGNSATPLCLV